MVMPHVPSSISLLSLLLLSFLAPALQLYSLSPSLKLSGPHGWARAYKSKCCLEYFNLIIQEVISFVQGSAVCQKGVLQVMKMNIPR